MTTPLVPVVATAAGMLVVAVGVITVTFAVEYASTRDPRPVASRPRVTDDPNWLLDLLGEEEHWRPWWPGAGVDHLYPDCAAYQRAEHRRDLRGHPVPGVGRIDPDDTRVCGHCRKRRDREELAASA